MQYKVSRSDTCDGILYELPARSKDFETIEGSPGQTGTANPAAVKSQEKQLLLEKLMRESLEEVPTPTQLSKAKE